MPCALNSPIWSYIDVTPGSSREVTHFQPARLTRPTRPDLLSAHACEVVNPNPCLANRLPRPGVPLAP